MVDRIDRRNDETLDEFSFPSIIVVGFGVLTTGFESLFLRCLLYGVNGVFAVLF